MSNRLGKYTPHSEKSFVTVKLLPIIKVFENSEYLITTTLEAFQVELVDRLAKYPHLNGDRKLLELVMDKVSYGEVVIDIVKIEEELRIVHGIDFIIALLLESGSCNILEKRKQKHIEKIEVETHGLHVDWLAGYGGRRFRIDGEIFFETEDWVS
jgi:hypothetical protein